MGIYFVVDPIHKHYEYFVSSEPSRIMDEFSDSDLSFNSSEEQIERVLSNVLICSLYEMKKWNEYLSMEQFGEEFVALQKRIDEFTLILTKLLAVRIERLDITGTIEQREDFLYWIVDVMADVYQEHYQGKCFMDFWREYPEKSGYKGWDELLHAKYSFHVGMTNGMMDWAQLFV